MPAPSIDIGILTIRDDEFRAVLAEFPDEAGIHQGKRDYTLRYADAGKGGRYTVAVLRQIEQGNGEAQDAARDLLDDLDPSLLLVVGIAAGLPSDDFTLGDVILSTRVNDYSVEARKARSKPTYSLSGGPIAKTLASRVANLAGRERELGKWTDGLPQRPKVQWRREGQLYGPKRWQKELAEKLEAHFGRGTQPRPPTFMAGPIASSDRLVKDPAVLFPWIATARHLLAIEMESGGVYRAARERCPMLAIRGISDLVGLKRSDAWTKFACASSAAFARAFLRTQPVRPRSSPTRSTNGSRGQTVDSDQPPLDTLYANLVPLVKFPETLFIAPTTCGTYEQAWGRIRNGADGYVTKAWVLHDKNVYSFEDPSTGPLARVADTTRIEAHASVDWAEAADADLRRVFVHLLGGALKDDLGIMGVWHFKEDDVYAFAGRPDEPPRTYRYQNVRLRSTITVVSHYVSEAKDGRKFPYLRHLGFKGRFRLLGGKWFLEVTPTYRFTTDGKKKSWVHEARLSGIKRLEGNRAVLSQVLLWADVLTAQPTSATGRRKHLTFGPVPVFEVERPVSDDDLTSVDADELPADELVPAMMEAPVPETVVEP